MPKLLIIADDLTGALDTGVKFAKTGMSVMVSCDWENVKIKNSLDVLVLCVSTRHASAEGAYQLIRYITEDYKDRFSIIMKKTDSGMRGNIGAELQAVIDGCEEQILAFLPALPEMNRTTMGGIQYIDGVPVSKSVFGRDPFEPVREDDISKLLKQQCSARTEVIPAGHVINTLSENKTILIVDSTSDSDMQKAAAQILADGRIRLLAGCSGLAKALAGELGAGKTEKTDQNDQALLVMCGSVNSISTKQLDYAEKKGFDRFRLPMDFLLSNTPVNDEMHRNVTEPLMEACRSKKLIMIDTLPPDRDYVLPQELELHRQQIASRLGELIKTILDYNLSLRILVIGGDTLQALMEAVHSTVISPICEPEQGVVLSCLRYKTKNYQILSKSGGFGEEDLLLRLLNCIDTDKQHKEEQNVCKKV